MGEGVSLLWFEDLSCLEIPQQVCYILRRMASDGTGIRGSMLSRSLRILTVLLVHGSLLVLTLCTATLAGVYWNNKDPLELENISNGLTYAVLLIAFLLSHELGHYLAARAHGVSASLPYFIPFPSFLGINPFGTLGAVIRLRSAVPNRKALFDIGAAGPISGFIVSIVFLVVGFRTLPPIEYLYEMHPEYSTMAAIPEGGLRFGKTILYSLLGSTIPPPGSFIPPMNEMYHYPFLCVGWFGLFVTAMNLIPVGQLDGGHVAHAILGQLASSVGWVAIGFLATLGIAGILQPLGISSGWGWSGWLVWAILLLAFTRGLKESPSSFDLGEKMDTTRIVLFAACLLILLVSFSVTPIDIRTP